MNKTGSVGPFTYADWKNSSYKFTTADGMMFMLYSAGNGWCTDSESSIATSAISQVCASVEIDVNGPKGPNFYGRDIFDFYISNGKGPLLYPRGGIDDQNGYWKDSNYCSTDDNSDDAYCSSRIMEEGWQMKY